MKLTDLINATVEDQISWRGNTLSLVWRPDAISRGDLEEFDELLTEIRNASDADSPNEERIAELNDRRDRIQCELLAKGLQSWGLQDVEPTADVFGSAEFPPMLFLALHQRLEEILSAGKNGKPKQRGR